MCRIGPLSSLAAFLATSLTAQVANPPALKISTDDAPLQGLMPVSPGWPFGQPRTHVKLEGILAHADNNLICIELPDRRVIRFRLDNKTRYKPEAGGNAPFAFHVADVVRVESEVDSGGFLLARSVSLVRGGTAQEQAEIFQSPELMQRWKSNLLASRDTDPALDDRKLELISKPAAITESPAQPELAPAEFVRRDGSSSSASDPLIDRVRESVDENFATLPNFRARQVTSMFGSTSKPIRWVPAGVVSAEISYEEGRESYNEIDVDGKQRADAPAFASSDYMRSLNRAWSTGDFETIAHCVLSELPDADFERAGTEVVHGETLITYKFHGQRSSGCIGIAFTSQIAYPAYTGSMKIDPQTAQIRHVEMSASEIPSAFPLDRAERSVDLSVVQVGSSKYLLPATAYWFGCFRSSYSCFLNRIDFRDYRRFDAESILSFDK